MEIPGSLEAPFPTPPALRTTQMLVLADITPAIERYERLGLSRVSTGDDGCVGMVAGPLCQPPVRQIALPIH
jgi:hypothetical protein